MGETEDNTDTTTDTTDTTDSYTEILLYYKTTFDLITCCMMFYPNRKITESDLKEKITKILKFRIENSKKIKQNAENNAGCDGHDVGHVNEDTEDAEDIKDTKARSLNYLDPWDTLTDEMCIIIVLITKKLSIIPEKYHTKSLTMLALYVDNVNVSCINFENNNYNNDDIDEICVCAITKSPAMLKFIPDKFRTEHVYIAFAERTSSLEDWNQFKVPICYIKYIKSKILINRMFVLYFKELSPEMILRDLQCYGKNIQHIINLNIPGYLTQEMYNAALSCSGLILRIIPRELLTYESCLTAVTQNGMAIRFVPGKFKTHELCLAAVSSNGLAIGYIDNKRRTPELCLAAVSKDGAAIRYIKRRDITQEICDMAVLNCGSALQFIPKKLVTYEMCLNAVSVNHCMLKYVDEKFRTDEFYIHVASIWPCLIDKIPRKLRTEKNLLLMMKQDPSLILYLDSDEITPELCLIAIKKTGVLLTSIPKDIYTEEMCLIAVEHNSFLIEHIPEDKRTEAVCLAAVSKCGMLIECVPESMKTEKVCFAALMSDPCAVRYINPEKVTKEMHIAAIKTNPILYIATVYMPNQKQLKSHLYINKEILLANFAIKNIAEKCMISQQTIMDVFLAYISLLKKHIIKLQIMSKIDINDRDITGDITDTCDGTLSTKSKLIIIDNLSCLIGLNQTLKYYTCYDEYDLFQQINNLLYYAKLRHIFTNEKRKIIISFAHSINKNNPDVSLIIRDLIMFYSAQNYNYIKTEESQQNLEE